MLSTSVLYTLLATSAVPLVLVFIKIITWIRRKLKIAAVVGKIPGPETETFLGHLRKMPRDGEKRLQWEMEACNRFKTSYNIFLGPFISVVILCHPGNAKKLLKTTEPKQTADGSGYSLLLDWLGKGLLINSGNGWFRNRRLLTPAFHFDVLKPYCKIYNEASDKFLETIMKQVESSPNNEAVIEVFKPVGLCTLKVMLKCAFSYEEDIQTQGESNPYVQTVAELSELILKRIFNPILYANPLYYMTANGKKWKRGCEFAHNVAYDLIQRRQRELHENGSMESIKSKRAVDFLDILLLARDDNGHGLTDVEIRSEVDTFLFEGHDTTASAISWCIHNLASHPEYQHRAREEVDDLLDGRDSDHIEWDDLNRLPYLTMCIKESMRHTPPVPFFGRELEHPLEIDGVMLPPGTNLAVNVQNLHHNPLVWGEDHMEYKPERFLHENMKQMDSHAFIPFSAGPRNCIGQNFAMNEIKTVIARILRKFTLDIDPSRRPKPVSILVMRSDTGIHVKFTPR